MRQKIKWLVVVLLAGMARPMWGEPKPAIDRQITVLVFDHDRLAQLVDGEAEREARKIFKRARLDIRWRNCSVPLETRDPDCRKIPGPDQFVVTIVARSKQPTGDVFGVAFLDENGQGKYADVFFDRVNTLHRDAGANLGRLLGAVVAHEIGHLLGFKSHSMWGIMSAHWEQDHLRRLERGALLFTPEQALRMQAQTNQRP
jgi:hypothetical protein